MKTFFLSLLVFILFGITQTNAQIDTTRNFDSLLCKKWVVQFIEQNGQRTHPTEDEKNTMLIFNIDHSFLSNDTNDNWKGTWEYDKATSTIIIIDNEEKTKEYLRIMRLNSNNCILIYKDPDDGTVLRICLLAKPN